MVTFIVVLILIAVVIAFAVLLIVKKGKLAKQWFISFGGVVLAGIICISVAVPVTTNKAKKDIEAFTSYKEDMDELSQIPNVSQGTLGTFYRVLGYDVAKYNEWLKEQQKLISTGIYWDITKEYRDQIMAFTPIPYIIVENGVYKLIVEE